jgi:hypothetical protein
MSASSKLVLWDAELLQHRVKNAGFQFAGLNGCPFCADADDLMAAFAP